MKLAVFDIDGTLTLGDGLGTRCFFESFEAVFGAADRRLESYAESTDCGIAREAAAKTLGRAASEGELAKFKTRYLELLEHEMFSRDRAYRAVAGAEEFLPLLASQGDWTVAIATGNWRRAAELKLHCAEIAAPPVAACSEDGGSRAEVLACAIRTAKSTAGRNFERVVYVGDQLWDLRAARELGVGFLGMGSASRGQLLAESGARVVENYLDAKGMLGILEELAAAR